MLSPRHNSSILRAALFFLLLVGNFAVALAAEPTASTPLGGGGLATTFRVSGSIDQVLRKWSTICFFAEVPFWGPPRYGSGRAALWPKDTLFVLFIPTVPITIDGKKASFHDLAPGQKIQVQYNLEERESTIRCIANRIDARSAPPSLSISGQSRPAALTGHWRCVRPGLTVDYSFAASGNFRGELAEHGKPLRHFGGTWSVAGDALKCDITESDIKGFPPGTKDQDKLVQLTKDYYVVETRHGTLYRYTRLPK